jgi:hypothetical protein
MFKAPEGTVFLADVGMSLPVDKSILAALAGSDNSTAARRLLQTEPAKELKQFWFNDATKVSSMPVNVSLLRMSGMPVRVSNVLQSRDVHMVVYVCVFIPLYKFVHPHLAINKKMIHT